MKHIKVILTILFLSLVISSCSNSLDHRISAQWQLRTISYPDGTEDRVDTIFYAFQRQAIFSYGGFYKLVL